MARAFLLTFPLFLAACPEQGVKAFNAEPEAEILSHSDGQEVLEGYTESFTGQVSDPDHSQEDLTVTWYAGDQIACESTAAEADGSTSCEISITADTTEVRLEVLDPGGAAGSDRVELSVTPTDSPEAEITAPTTDGVYYSDQLITFEGIVSDGEDAATDLVVTWESSLDGTLEAEATPNDDGEFAGADYLGEGEHFLTLTATDTTGKSGSDNVTVTVGPPNSAPSCAITAPESNAADEVGTTVVFEGTTEDVDVSPDWLSVTWSSDKDGEIGSSTPNSSGGITFAYADLSVNTHLISMTVSDEIGATCTDDILYSVGTAPEIEILTPISGEVVNEGELAQFTAEINDGEDTATDLVLSWVSDLDGEFSTQGSDSTGTIAFTEYDLSVGTHTITATVTDTDGLYASALVTLRINGIPTAPVVAISPDPATTSDELFAVLTTPSTDVDGDPITYAYSWSLSGMSPTAITTTTLSDSVTSSGQTWTVEITPDDGFATGPSGTASITISNTAPVVSAVSIDPDPATAEDTLLCEWSFDDDDGDADESTLEWTVNGTSAGTDATLTGAFTYGDTVTCTVTAHDGSDTGNTESTSLTIDNTAPVLAEVTLSPDPATEADTLICTAGDTTDADGTTGFDYAYAWTVSGVDIGVTDDTLDGTDFAKNDDVFCTVIPNDGDDDGDAVDSNTVTIDNTAPSISSVSIAPASPRPTDTLTCSYSGFDDADGDSDASTYSWTIDGVEVGTSDTLSSGYAADDVVTCTVTPNDGDEDGTALSDSVTIQNTPPEVTDVSLSPSTVQTNDIITATVGTSDDEGDPISLTYAWYVDGSLVAETSDTLDGATYFDKNDDVYVVVTPNDGYDDGDAVSSSSIIVSNTAPGAPSISIEPTEPTAGADDLLCQIDADSSDEDGDSISYTIDWEVDGVTYTDATTTHETGDTVPGAETIGDEIWTCTVTPNDGDEDGTSVSTSVLTTGCFEGWDDTEVDLIDAGYSFIGEESGDHSGRSVSSAGDVDGDGLDDLLIGAGYNDRGDSSAGAAYIILAASLASDTEIDLEAADYILVGVDNDDTAGLTVAAAGDVDGDGLDDILVGAEAEDTGSSNAGGTYVILGASLGASQVISLDDADYLLYGENNSDYSASGSSASIASAGDVDGDGLDDILIGAPANSDNGAYAGKAYLVLGGSLDSSTMSLSDADFAFYGESAGDNAGTSVASAGDVDGDGLDDILVGAFSEDTNGGDSGATYLFLGASLGTSGGFDLGDADIILYGETEGDYSSWGIAGPGDVDGDGLDDILVGAKLNDEGSSDAGKVYLVLGSSLGSSATIQLSDADVMMWGELGESVGHSISGAGDVDGDGLADLWIGAYGTSPNGSAYLVLGANVDAGVNLQLNDEAIRFTGENTSDIAGYSVSAAGDIDGDGLSDLLVGAYGNDDGGSAAGKTYLVVTPSACNTPPRGTEVSISPEDPIEDLDDLVCTIDTEAYDPDGDSISYLFEWEVDGMSYTDAITTTESGDTVPAEDIFAAEEWTCIVTPDDGTDDGAESTASVTIGADAPECMALELDGTSSQYVTADQSADFDLDISVGATIEGWIYNTTRSSKGIAIESRAPGSGAWWSVRLAPTYLTFETQSSSVATSEWRTSSDPEDSWYHFAVVFSSSFSDGAKIFIDGQESTDYVRLASDYTDPVITEEPLYFGAHVGGSWDMDGLFYQVRFSDTARYTSDFSPDDWLESDTDTVALWDFTTGSGSTVSDLSGNGHDATINDGTWVEECPEDCIEDSGATEDCPAESCLSILDAGLDTGDGYYWLDPDGSGAEEMYCDMTTDGGGWTRIHMADSTSIYAPTGMNYSFDYPGLRSDSDEVLMQFMAESDDSVYGSYAQFDIPSDWVSQSPFFYSGSATTIDVSIDGGAYQTETLRYGYSNIGAFDTCSSITFPASGSPFGLLCITDTAAPFYGGWAETVGDYCTASDLSLDSGRCVGNMLAILVR